MDWVKGAEIQQLYKIKHKLSKVVWLCVVSSTFSLFYIVIDFFFHSETVWQWGAQEKSSPLYTFGNNVLPQKVNKKHDAL